MTLKTTLACWVAVLGLALLAEVPTVSGECCPTVATRHYARKCNDCSEPQDVYCGARGGGGCNIFGCNCGGGCIQGDGKCYGKKKRSVDEAVNGTDAAAELLGSNGHQVVLMADKNGDGTLDGTEVKAFLELSGVQAGPNEWLLLDLDRDGKLAAHEIDSDLDKKVKIAISFRP